MLFCGFGVSFCLQRWCGFFEIEGDFAFASAYSGLVGTMTIVGEMVFVLAYSGGVFSKTFEGVSFRTGLRG